MIDRLYFASFKNGEVIAEIFKKQVPFPIESELVYEVCIKEPFYPSYVCICRSFIEAVELTNKKIYEILLNKTNL